MSNNTVQILKNKYQSMVVVINNVTYYFSDIISVELIDDSTQIQNSVTKTPTGSMIGRAVVGGILGGGIGAVVGGITAKKKTVTDAYTKRDFKVLITVNDLSNPQVLLEFGGDEATARATASRLAVIIEQNRCLSNERDYGKTHPVKTPTRKVPAQPIPPQPLLTDMRRANDPNTTPDILAQLAAQDKPKLTRAVAKNTSTPDATLRELAEHTDASVRYEVANNPSTPSDILSKLSQDSDEIVRRAAKRVSLK